MSGNPAQIADYIAIGKIVRVRGVLGELVVLPLTDFPERFERMDTIFLEKPEGGEILKMGIAFVRRFKAQLLLTLTGIESRDDAETLLGSFLYVTRDQLVELPDDSFFQFEIVGMEVLSDGGERLGRIAEVMQFPANDVWRVEGEAEILLPAIKNVILNVDREKRVITVHLLEGLVKEKLSGKKKSR